MTVLRSTSTLCDELTACDYAALSDEELWTRFARANCELSLRALHKRYFDPLHAWIRRCGVRDDARIADLFQDVWIRLINHRHDFNPAMRWGTWAFHVARNIARNEGRRLGRQRVASEADFRLKDDETAQVRSAVSTSLPEEMMRERELDARLKSVLDALPPEQCTIFRLRYLEGRSNEEVAQILDIELSALKARAKRVRLKVLGEMGDLLEESG
jgi:RNA polymerase sigma-70 factor (ECF subfamily)